MTYHSDEVARYEAEQELGVERLSDRSRGVALALGLCAGILGLHRFYAGRVASGVWMIFTLGGAGIWWLYDVILLAAGEFRDVHGRRIREWMVHGPALEAGPGDRGIERVAARVVRLEHEVAELAERLDFAERLLAQHRERDRLSRG